MDKCWLSTAVVFNVLSSRSGSLTRAAIRLQCLMKHWRIVVCVVHWLVNLFNDKLDRLDDRLRPHAYFDIEQASVNQTISWLSLKGFCRSNMQRCSSHFLLPGYSIVQVAIDVKFKIEPRKRFKGRRSGRTLLIADFYVESLHARYKPWICGQQFTANPRRSTDSTCAVTARLAVGVWAGNPRSLFKRLSCSSIMI